VLPVLLVRDDTRSHHTSARGAIILETNSISLLSQLVTGEFEARKGLGVNLIYSLLICWSVIQLLREDLSALESSML
jgi:hypothetical protein